MVGTLAAILEHENEGLIPGIVKLMGAWGAYKKCATISVLGFHWTSIK